MIYLDNNATTRLDDEVLEAMLPYLKEQYGNASSLQHRLGRNANQAIEKSRLSIANYFGVSNKEIFFTSGATESINMVLRGVFDRYQSIGKHIITTRSEHKAVLNTLENLEKKGAEISYIPLQTNGKIDPKDIQQAIRKDTILIVIMHANNETGVLQDIHKIAEIANQNQILFFTDSTQSLGKIPFDYVKSGVDMFCFSAHKFHGPKGAGGLYIRRKSRPIQIEPIVSGGKQENGLRGGTYNTPAIVGMGKAFESFNPNHANEIKILRDYLELRLCNEIEETTIHAQTADRLYNTSNVLFKHVRSSELMNKLPNIALSSGSACVSGDRDPSHVLIAMGITEEDALCSIRFGLSKYTTKEEIDIAVEAIKDAVYTIRGQSPIWQLYKLNAL